MATAGSGDVLSGVIGAFLARGLKPVDAAVLGVWVHSKAGDLAARDDGYHALSATDLIQRLGQALKPLES